MRALRLMLMSLASGSAIIAWPATAQTAAAAQAPSADGQLRAIYDAEWAFRQKELARVDEDGGMAGDDHLPKVDAASQRARTAYWRGTLAALDKIPVDRLSPEEQINYAVFREVIEKFVSDGEFQTWQMPLTALNSFWADVVPRGGFGNAVEYRRYIGRMRDIPRYFDEQMANMRAGLKSGYSLPRVALEGRDVSISGNITDTPEKSPLYTAFIRMPTSIPAAEQEALRAEAKAVIAESVTPSFKKLLSFFTGEYLPKTRTTLAAEKLPNGPAYYRAQVRYGTTLTRTPEDIHQTGLKEVARITAEMEAVKTKAGFTGTLADFKTFLRTDPQFYAKTPDELMGASSYVAKRADGELKNVLGLLPRYRFTIRPVPDAIAPFFTSGYGGLESCLMNTYDLPSRALYQLPALTLHECAPGHSLQIALGVEGPSRPNFRKAVYFSGYGEGWGLYTEWLGTSMGIYRTPYEEFGRLSYEMWRASRLVIDTGIHHYGWSREKAIAYLSENTALSKREVETEIDRYITYPGQALSYKLGEMTILRKRAEAEAKLGAAFDQRWFHDTILGLGSVPLPVLEKQIDLWIAGGGKNPNAPAS